MYPYIIDKCTRTSRSRHQLVLKQVYIQKTFLCHACLYCIYVTYFLSALYLILVCAFLYHFHCFISLAHKANLEILWREQDYIDVRIHLAQYCDTVSILRRVYCFVLVVCHSDMWKYYRQIVVFDSLNLQNVIFNIFTWPAKVILFRMYGTTNMEACLACSLVSFTSGPRFLHTIFEILFAR